MFEILSKCLEIIKIFKEFIKENFIYILLFLFLLGLSILILPSSILGFLQINNLALKYHEIIAIVVYISGVGILLLIIIKLVKQFKEKCNRDKIMKNLTLKEREYLILFTHNNTQTQTFSLYDGVVAGLVNKGILYNPGSKSNKSGEQDFNISQFAYKYLEDNKSFFKQGTQNDKK